MKKQRNGYPEKGGIFVGRFEAHSAGPFPILSATLEMANAAFHSGTPICKRSDRDQDRRANRQPSHLSRPSRWCHDHHFVRSPRQGLHAARRLLFDLASAFANGPSDSK